jgi:hypothetical protein
MELTKEITPKPGKTGETLWADRSLKEILGYFVKIPEL